MRSPPIEFISYLTEDRASTHQWVHHHGLRIAIELGVKRLMVYGDSALVVKLVMKEWEANEKMDEYVAAIWKLENKFYGLEFHHVVRDNNAAMDVISKLGSTGVKIPARVFVHDLTVPSVTLGAVVDEPPPQAQIMAILEGPTDDWHIPFIQYLTDATVPQVHIDEDKVILERLIRRSKNYILLDGKLMQKNAKEEILQKCITQEEGIKLLNEIHGGYYGNHATSRTLVGKAF